MNITTTLATLRSTEFLIPLKTFASMIESHPQTIYGWVREGRIPHIRIGSRIRFEGPVVAAWLDQRRVGSL